ncbi:monooxygenase [Hypoxylon sp. FL1284]|nr:monooxygenase [Hypoxylon sp. FL1284]
MGSTADAMMDEYPKKSDLRKELCQPLPVVTPGTVDAAAMSEEETSKQARLVLSALNDALSTNDSQKLASCFFADQSYWRDMLALTYHLRTFKSPSAISAALLETKSLRGLDGDISIQGTPAFIPATPALQFIDCRVTFRTSTPAATCNGRIILLPTKSEGTPSKNTLEWKIWVLTTWIDNLDVQGEDEALLKSPGRKLDGAEPIETDVLIVGGGNSGIILAARLKALGVDSLVLERNPETGDNWGLRYDCMTFHVPTSSTDTPYISYADHFQSPHLLKRKELAEHLKQYSAAFNLNVINSAKIQSTEYDQVNKRWAVHFKTPEGDRKVVSKQFVQATGIGSQKPYIPAIPGLDQYKGISVHSAGYKNGKSLVDKGAKSVLVIGSANTAFDIVEDCHDAGLQTTMIVRSETYVVPIDYITDEKAFGAYDRFPVDVVDKNLLTLPVAVESQLTKDGLAFHSSLQPDRYKALAAAGFPVIDGTHPDAHLPHNLYERCGGHYVDVDTAVHLVSDGKVGVRGGVEPVGFTATGLRLSDGSTADADAVVWCTGFADRDARDTAAEILSGGALSGVAADGGKTQKDVLDPRDVAARLDATWALDAEGEFRGVWKRHLRMENYWFMGGHTQFQRWYSRIVAQQIRLALDGTLPPAYRETP